LSKRVLTLSALLVVALFAAGSATGEPASVVSKQAQAQSVLAQIQSLDASLEHAIEAYNLANEKLEAIRSDLRENREELAIAEGNLKRAQRALASRVVAIYTSGESDSTLDVLVGSRSLADLVEGLEAVARVSEQDTHVLGDVTKFRTQVQRRRAQLKRARAPQSPPPDCRRNPATPPTHKPTLSPAASGRVASGVTTPCPTAIATSGGRRRVC